MSLRLRTSLLFAFTLAGLACLPPAASAQSPAEHEAEAQRLFERAQAYVRNVTEGDYTYDYIQFYWKRAQANIDRIRRVYPATAVGRQVASDALQLGPFPFAYFRERVLPALRLNPSPPSTPSTAPSSSSTSTSPATPPPARPP